MEVKIQHFSHEEHPLVLFVEDIEDEGVCTGCNKSVCAPAYKCSHHCNFFLHKSCAELSREIQYPLHPNHTLLLQTPSGNYICDACLKSCEKCFFNTCKPCKFDIHIECASIWRSNNTDDGHQHEFFPIFHQIHFTCEVCGEDRNSTAQVCRICQLVTHAACTQKPRSIRIRADRHLLTLIYSLGQVIKEHHHNVFCSLCYKQINLKYAGYYCQQCDSVAHLECAQENSIGASSDAIDVDSSIQEEGIDFEEGEELEELEHFNHEHKLILSRDDDEVLKVHHNKLCEGCIQLIISAPFYSCQQCNYFLHSKCARLPSMKRHPTHPHLLNLYPFGFVIGETVSCAACRRFSHGFAYACYDCRYSLDIRCCSIPKTLEHKGHKHSLFLAPSSAQDCNSCEGQGQRRHIGVFVCKECDFVLGFECATLPLKVEYEHDPHPLSLTYTAENDYEECYCLICEEKRSPNHWFYYCEKCDFVVRPRCIVGRHPYIKYGRDFTWKVHQHPLNFVRRTKDFHPCDSCSEIFDEDVAINCIQCKSNVHLRTKCMDRLRIK